MLSRITRQATRQVSRRTFYGSFYGYSNNGLRHVATRPVVRPETKLGRFLQRYYTSEVAAVIMVPFMTTGMLVNAIEENRRADPAQPLTRVTQDSIFAAFGGGCGGIIVGCMAWIGLPSLPITGPLAYILTREES